MRLTPRWPSLTALGAFPGPNGTWFRVWAPGAKQVDVHLFARDGAEARFVEKVALDSVGDGRFEALAPDVREGALYKFSLDGRELPDPFARFLPWGVHGPAEVIARGAATQEFRPVPSHQLSLYELHIGCFTREGTYAAARERLADVANLGVTAIELLPLSSIPGDRGWGYDGVAHFAPPAAYGRPDELRALIAEAHRLGLAVILDVVYNHFGPAGNYLGAYARDYFGDANNPWGQGPNFAEPRMRSLVIDNARLWFDEYGFDGLRLDATHAIHDPSPKNILRELHELAASYPIPKLLFAEDDRNEPALVRELGIDGIWADDFHHQCQVLLTGDRDGYYACYEPTLAALARTIQQGWTYQGEVYPLWQRPRGKSTAELSPENLVYCLQNHDQVGNRALGTRLSHDAALEKVEAATALLLFLPMTPLLFMGQEWAASTPFLFFTDHDAELGPKVSEGRANEFAKFAAFADPAARARIPDPQVRDTFERSKLRWDERRREPHRRMLELTTRLLALRREDPVLREPCLRSQLSARVLDGLLVVERRGGAGVRRLVVNLSERDRPLPGSPPAEVVLATQPLRESGVAAHSAVIVSGGATP